MATLHNKPVKPLLRILMVSDIYYPYPGGISEHIHHLTLELRRQGHEVQILTARYREKTFDFQDPPWVIRVGRGIKIPINKSFSKITFSPRITRWVKKVLDEGHYHIVHAHSPLTPTLPMLSILYSRSVNFGTFHAAHDFSRGYELFKPILLRVFERLDGRIAVSEVARASVARHFPGEYRIIPNGVDIRRFRPEGPRLAPYDQGRWRNLLFVGRFDPRKGLKTLLKAMPLVVARVPEARLLVVGGGPLEPLYRSQVPEEVEDRVLFLGFLSPEDLSKAYRTAEIFVSPATTGESFGIVLLEAMASGVPIVASDIPGYRQVMENGREGLFARPEDPEDLANKIVYLLRHPEEARAMGQRGRQKAVERYAWEVVAKQVEAYYYEVLEEKGWPGFTSLTATM